MEPRRPQLLDAGLFLIAVAVPLALFPLSRAPFADAKLLLLSVGTLLVWASGVPASRRLSVPAAAWFGVCLVAAVAGADPLTSVIGQFASTGLVLLGICALLVVIGPRLSERAVSHIRRWLVPTGLVVAAVALAYRFVPEALDRLVPDLSFVGSTLGNPIFAAAFLAACIPAAIADEEGRTWKLLAILTVITSGLAVNGERSSLLLPLVALAASAWFGVPDRRRMLAGAVTVVVVVIGWALVTPLLPTSTGLSSTVEQFGTLKGEQQRVAVYTANLRAFSRRPVLGWGPGNAWSGYLNSASASEVRTAGRGWGDAHDLPLQSLVTTGVIGTAALLFLLARAAPGLSRRRRSSWWVPASASTLAVFHLYEPLNLVVTPLLFLLLGVATGESETAPQPSPTDLEPQPAASTLRTSSSAIAARILVATLLTMAVVVSGLVLTASALEQWGRTHYAEWALQRSLDVQPWRISAAETLAFNLALDGRAGDATAAREARALIKDTVEDHPWDPGVRIVAAGVEQLLRNPAGAQRWIDEQLRRFPSDVLPTGEPTLVTPSATTTVPPSSS
ncbi:MAG TPA: O-antigen ligase family protein [Actinomycetota bacterium]